MTVVRIHICPLPRPTPPQPHPQEGTWLTPGYVCFQTFCFAHAIVFQFSLSHNYRPQDSCLVLTWVPCFHTPLFPKPFGRCRQDSPLPPTIFPKNKVCLFHGCNNTMIRSTALVKVWPAVPLVSFTATPWPSVSFSDGLSGFLGS